MSYDVIHFIKDFRLFPLMIMMLILQTFSFDYLLIMQGENGCWSSLGTKGIGRLCLVPRPYYSAQSMRFDRGGLGRRRMGTRQGKTHRAFASWSSLIPSSKKAFLTWILSFSFSRICWRTSSECWWRRMLWILSASSSFNICSSCAL